MASVSQAIQGFIGVLGVVAIVSVGFFVWKTAAARVNGEAAQTWKSIAEAYEAKLELKDSQVADMRADHARIEGEMKEQISGLRLMIEELKKRDQVVVLAAISEHERSAATRAEAAELRHQEAVTLWTEIRDGLHALAPEAT